VGRGKGRGRGGGSGGGFQFAGNPGSFRLFLSARAVVVGTIRLCLAWKRASYTIATTWPQFQLFSRYRQIERTCERKKSARSPGRFAFFGAEKRGRRVRLVCR